MKRILTIAAVCFGAVAFGQQEFQTTQYQQNMYLINPGAAGVKDYVDLNLGFRQQWAGFDGAPKTYFISANSMIGKNSMGGNKLFSLRISDPSITVEDGYDLDENNTVIDRKVRHALGGYFMVDEAGAFRSNIGALSYAVHVPLSQKTTASIGVKAKVNNLAFDADRVRFNGQDQNTTYTNFINGGSSSNTYFDAGLGAFIYHDKFFAGVSLDNLFNNEIAFTDAATNATLNMHTYLTAGYRFALSETVGLTPSTLVRMTKNAPTSIDLSAKVDINNRFWAGLTVRPEDAFAVMAGLGIAKNINLGYSYDITTSNINQRGNGTHEFVINIMLDKN